MKICCRCKEEKNENEFHKERKNKDGLSYKCKECQRKIGKEYREKNPEKVKETQRKSLEKNKESIRASQKKHVEKNRDKINERKKVLRKKDSYKEKARLKRLTPEFREKARIRQQKLRDTRKDLIYAWRLVCTQKNKIKILANQQLGKAIKRGKIIRPDKCENCKIECKPDGHHEDYSKPLDVKWLCKTCHAHEHGKLMDVNP